MAEHYPVVAGTGSLRPTNGVVTPQHAWTDEGVAVETPFAGPHLLHLAVAGCVLIDTHRGANRRRRLGDG